jgi:hypothetical protein
MSQLIINDVGPRDGLQNQAKHLAPSERIDLVRALLAAGLRHVEVGAFVSPKAVPAMAGADEILEGLNDEDLDKPTPEGAPDFLATVRHVFELAVWHEGIHVGQLTVARRALGHAPLVDMPPEPPA